MTPRIIIELAAAVLLAGVGFGLIVLMPVGIYFDVSHRAAASGRTKWETFRDTMRQIR